MSDVFCVISLPDLVASVITFFLTFRYFSLLTSTGVLVEIAVLFVNTVVKNGYQY